MQFPQQLHSEEAVRINRIEFSYLSRYNGEYGNCRREREADDNLENAIERCREPAANAVPVHGGLEGTGSAKTASNIWLESFIHPTQCQIRRLVEDRPGYRSSLIGLIVTSDADGYFDRNSNS